PLRSAASRRRGTGCAACAGPRRGPGRSASTGVYDVTPPPDPSERSVRAAVAAAAPTLAGEPIELPPGLDELEDPEWHAATAFVGDAYVVKFAWSAPAAIRIRREAAVLALLADAAPSLPVPVVV